MDETAVYFESRPRRTVHATGARTVPIRAPGRSNQRLTACLSVAADGTKLPLFVILRGEPDGRIEKSINTILPGNVHGCVQSRAWMG